MNVQLLAEWAQKPQENCLYDPETLGLYDGEKWLDRDDQAEFYEWCGDPMYVLRWRVMSAFEAGDILNAGGHHWVLFHGDTFDRDEFSKWARYYPTESDALQADDALSNIDKDQAMLFWCEYLG